jgi:transposase
MEKDERQQAKAQLIAGMLQGQSWVTAAAAAGYPLRRSGAYRLLSAVRSHGEAALRDGRQGHPSKLRGPVRQWLEDYCRGAPQASGAQVQRALEAQCGLRVSVSQINRVRAALGLGRSAANVGGKGRPSAHA